MLPRGTLIGRPGRWRLPALGLAAMLVAAPASAQIVQSVHLGAGRFSPRGFDSRHTSDTIAADLTAAAPLKFDIGHFSSGQLFGEWNMQFGNHIEVGVGAGYYTSQVFSTYRDLVNRGGGEIRQELRLRIAPFTSVVRILPFGSPSSIQPYVGVGVGAFKWRYAESGQFVETSDNSVFTDRFIATGTSAGQVALWGVRVPVGADAVTLEWRYQFGAGRTGGLPAGFLGERIDLGGGTLNFGFLRRF